jgi:hypothetical protein
MRQSVPDAIRVRRGEALACAFGGRRTCPERLALSVEAGLSTPRARRGYGSPSYPSTASGLPVRSVSSIRSSPPTTRTLSPVGLGGTPVTVER